MRENGLKKLWAEGRTAVNGWLAIPSSYSAEAMAHEDFDSVTVDMQHGMIDFQAAVSMLQAISTTAKTPMVRVPWNDPALIMKALDAGSYGVICPMISNREQCERFVGACRYPPRGYRSFGPPRGLLYGGADYPTASGDTILAFGMIETKEAMENLDAIMSTPGLDGVYVGPSDLSLGLGFSSAQDSKEPVVIEAIDRILKTAKKHKIIAGTHTASGDMAKRMTAKGFDLVTVMNDARLMSVGAKAEIAVARSKS